MSAHFDGKTAIVTGGASGLGKALAAQLVGAGARVIILDKDAMGVEAAARATAAFEARTVDVTDAQTLRAVVEEIDARWTLDYLFNNAGIIVGGEARDIPATHWDDVLKANLCGVVNGTTAAYPLMAARGRGHIINTASVVGLVPGVLSVPYTASKFGIVGLSQALRAEGRSLGVRVSVVCPGGMDTPIWNSPMQGGSIKTFRDTLSLFPLMLRLLTPADIAARRVLRGVARNRAVIYTDRYSRFMSLGYRLLPSACIAFSDKYVMRKFRSERTHVA